VILEMLFSFIELALLSVFKFWFVVKKLCFVLLIPLLFISCQKANLLNFKYYRYQKEYVYAQLKTNWLLRHEFRFDIPAAADDEITTFLTISIKDSAAFVKNRKANVVLQSSILTADMSDFCFGTCHEIEFYCHGTIELVWWKKNKIKIRENLFVTSNSEIEPLRIVQGVRTFRYLK